ncbi:hypothetical protein [Chengkuizengella axinellae]|uniref:ABC transporter permease n=1 Tax=Chengkuizengella axinellae TaxID=3064388 RepID=A0ABT9IWV7_9BACL|nr:hypothetical protein [Chengkuizengella sp. 2205SS18-9]MDP5273270.1 hypothetical protein [Chengkuizengella sp. 2205SS18-9]
MRTVLSLFIRDMKNIFRDPILLVSIFLPICLAILGRIFFPILEQNLFVMYAFNLSKHYDFMMSILLLLTPLLIGMLMGFMILEERDEGIILFMSVTPLKKSGYFIYRFGLPVLISVWISFFVLYITNIVPINIMKQLPVIVLLALEAPLIALCMGVLAGNKVEGLSVSKVLNIMLLAPFAGYFLESKIQLLAGVLPPYWASMAFMKSFEEVGIYFLYLSISVIFHCILFYVLFKWFNQKIEN